MKKLLISFLTILFLLVLNPIQIFAGYNTQNNIPTNYKNIGIPQDMVVLSNGDIWYVDTQNYRVVKIDSSGNILREIGREGSDWGEFESVITGLALDADGNLLVLGEREVYTLDSNGGMINKWGETGAGVGEFSIAQGIAYDTFSDHIFVSDYNNNKVMCFKRDGTFLYEFGGLGSGNGKLNHPVGLTTDATGKVYVVDGDNHRVQVFTNTGVYLSKFGTNGNGDGQFNFPKDVVILSNGKIAVTSQNAQKIQIFNSNGTFFSSFGENGSDVDQFVVPQYLATDTSNNIFVADWDKKSIQKFDNNGNFLWGYRNSGISNGKFTNPNSVAVDSLGNIYVLDDGSENARVQKFTNGGTYVSTILTVDDLGGQVFGMTIKSDKLYITNISKVMVYNLDGTLDFEFGEGGTGDGQFNLIRGIGVDSTGNIYVSDYYNNRIQKFDSTGAYLSQWGTTGTGNGEFRGPTNIYIDSTDNIFVASNNDPYLGYEPPEVIRVQVFNTSGVYQFSLGAPGDPDFSFVGSIGGIVKDSLGNLYVAEISQHRIVVYDNAYNYSGTFGTNGGGIGEFAEPNGLAYYGDSLIVADQLNHRVQYVSEGVRIYNLTPGTDVQRASDNNSLVTNYYDPTDLGMDNIDSEMYFGDYIVADFDVDLTADRDWADVNVVTAPTVFKTLVDNLDQTITPGLVTDTNIYVPKVEGQTAILICPDATTIDDINIDCSGGYELVTTDVSVQETTVDSKDYWKVLGVSNIGAMAMFPTTHFGVEISDTTLEPGDFLTVTVEALDQNNNVVTNYTGEVTISIPGLTSIVYTFIPSDHGVRTLTDEFQIVTPGVYTVEVSEGEITGVSANIVVAEAVNENETPNDGETETPVANPILTGSLSNIPTNDDDDVQEIIDDIVDGKPIVTDNDNVNIPTNSEVEHSNYAFLYWLIPLLIVVMYLSYRSLSKNSD